MTAKIRRVLAAAIIVVSALGGAAYAQHVAASESIGTPAHPTLETLKFGGDPNRRMLETAYEQVEHAYYLPVNQQLLLDGERRGLDAFLKRKHVDHPAIAATRSSGDPDRDLSVIEATLDTIAARYTQAGSKTDFTDAAVSGMLAGLGDPYTTFLSAAEIRSLDEELKGGDFGGIGVYIVQDPKTGAILVDPIEGNPAIRAGLRPGDIILAVDDHSTLSMKLDEVERLIRGPKGSIVALRIKRRNGAHTETIRVTRDDVHVPSVLAHVEDGISYVRLADFGTTSADEVRAAFEAAQRAGVRGYILDLRNNGGGLLDAAVDISSLVIPQGPIVSTIDRAGNRDTRSATGHALHPVPLVVLVNKYTASASEITAGALQDYRAATILGTKTFGKGVVQSLYPLPGEAGAIKITTARYVTPKGRDIHHKGIVPDVIVDQPVDVPIIDTPADRQLSAAKSILRSAKKDTR